MTAHKNKPKENSLRNGVNKIGARNKAAVLNACLVL